MLKVGMILFVIFILFYSSVCVFILAGLFVCDERVSYVLHKATQWDSSSSDLLHQQAHF